MKSIDGREGKGGGLVRRKRESKREPLRGREKIHAYFARASRRGQVREEKEFMCI